MKTKALLLLAALAIVMMATVLHCAEKSRLRTVVKVYDGDTIRTDDNRKIRLIGVDAPEVESPYSKEEPFGRESRLYLKNLIEGRKVLVKQGEVPVDRYGRVLAYVYMDNVLVNGRIIRDGFAKAYLRFDHENRDLFIVYEKEARAKRRGIWATEEKWRPE